MVYSLFPRATQHIRRSLPLHIGLILSISLPPAQIQASRSAPYQGINEIAQGDGQSRQLEAGRPIERELPGGESHSYRITMASGQYLQLVVDQRGIDVVVALFAPDDKKIVEVDSPNGTAGPENVLAIAERAGAYRIEVRAPLKTAETGRYEIKIEELREAIAKDKYRVEAGSVVQEARQLQNGTLEAKRRSIEKYHQALELYRGAGDRETEADMLNEIGLVYWSMGEMQKALENYNEALPIRRAVGDRRGEAITLNNIGLAHSSLGEMRKALEKYNESLPIRRAVGDRRGEATTLSNIGMVYRLLGEMQKALDNYNQAILIIKALGDRKREAEILNNIGSVYQLLGDTQNALEKHNQVLSIRQAVGDRRGESITLNNIGLIYELLGEMQKALNTHNESLSIRRAVGDRRGEAISLNNIGSIYGELGDEQRALEKFNEALPIYRAVGDRSGAANALNNIGAAYTLLGEMQRALEKYNEALPIIRAVGDRNGEAHTLNNIGSTYSSLGEMQKALEKFNESLTICRAVGNRSQEAAALNNIGGVYYKLGEMQKALGNYNEALLITRAIGGRNGEATTLLGIARVEQQLGNLTQARQTIEQAIGIVESLRADIGNQRLRASYFASQQKFYEFYIDVFMRLHEQNPTAAFDAAALAISERARARSLLELLTEARANIRHGVDSALLERERSLQQRLTAKASAQTNLLNREHSSAQADALAREIASITAEYEELEAQIRASSPRYAALTQPQPLNLTEIQRQVLDAETLLLEYSLGDDVSYLFIVSHNSITSHRLPKRAEIEAATRRVRELLTAPQPRPDDTATKRLARIKDARANYWPQAGALSRMLLGPATSQLGTKRLLIVADGALQYLPFGALPIPERREGNPPRRPVAPSPRPSPFHRKGTLPASPTPLMVEHEIVHLPSASTLAVLRRELAGRQPAPKAVAVIADPVFSADDARVRLATSDHKVLASNQAPSELTRALTDVRGDLTRLLMTRDEAQAILSITPPNARLGALDFRASRTTSTSDELSQYRIVHFATHGLLNSEHPNLSGLVLSLVDERGQQQDGFLQLHEIFNLRLPAELVVLSACQTGLGKEIKGEGLVGLTRGFMYAGAARVVASLWQVDDAATAELMKRFYRRMLQGGMRPAAALRAAQVEMWKRPQWQSPYYWGAFVLQGEWK